MKIRNFTLSGNRMTLIARTERNAPVYDLFVDESSLGGLTLGQLRAELGALRNEIDALSASYDVELFDKNWSCTEPAIDDNIHAD